MVFDQVKAAMKLAPCANRRAEENLSDVEVACFPPERYLEDHPHGTRAKEVRAALNKGQLRIARFRAAEVAKQVEEERKQRAAQAAEAQRQQAEARREAERERSRCRAECKMGCSNVWNYGACVSGCIGARCQR